MLGRDARPPRIVITGGPCSGKTKLFHDILAQYPDALGIPELASILARDIGVLRSDDPLIYRGPLWKMQRAVEASFYRMAQTLGDVRAVVLDSASVCNAGFLSGGIAELELLFRTTRQVEYARYDAVIWLSPPPEDVFERERANNSTRIETFAQARDIGIRMLGAWLHHACPRFVFSEDDDWEDKRDSAMEYVRSLIGNP